MRKDGRTTQQLRPIRIEPHFNTNALGSILIESGNTKVLCSASVEDSVPGWLRHSRQTKGWLTAEYSMLPGSTHSRTKRERQLLGGRTQEIQRLIGRSLRSIIDLTKCPDMTFVVDCDVLQADGGTRIASITGGFVALKLAVDRLLRDGKLKHNPLLDAVAAVSVGIKENTVLLDLDYSEDAVAELDMTVVLTQSGKIVELQGSAERSYFTKEQVIEIIDTAKVAVRPIFDLQNIAAEGQTALS